MNAIKHLDKQNLQEIKAEVLKRLTDLEAATGIKFGFNGGSYDPSVGSATLKFTIAVPTASGETPDQLYFKQYAHLYGFQPTDLGRKFVVPNQRRMTDTYTVDGLRNGRSKFKLWVKCARDGRRVLLPQEVFTMIKWVS